MDNIEEIIAKTVSVLKAGGTILYPTDTIWGIGCDAANATAIEKIYDIKQRDHSKSMLVLADSKEVQQYRSRDGRPTTYIVEVGRTGLEISPNLLAADRTIGVRVPRHAFCQRLLAAFGGAIVSTSANFSGKPSPTSHGDIDPLLKEQIDYCVPPYPQFDSQESKGSRIVKLNDDGSIITIRE